LVYPFVDNEPFHLSFDSRHWDFSGLLEILGGSNYKRDYETDLTAKANLTSSKGSFWDSTGTVEVEKFFVRHGTTQMQNTRPVLARFDNGQVNVEKIQIEGDNTQLSLAGTKNKNDTLNFNVNGRIDLSLLTFLTPFFKDMTGLLSVSTQIGGTLTHPE